MSEALGVGIVGFGYAAATFHAPLVQAVGGLRLVAVASGQAAKVHRELPGVAVAASPEALLAREDVAIVVIAAPNDRHYPLASQALAAGRHVVVDKPFTLTVAEARRLTQQAAAAGRVLSVFHNRRWDADFLTLQAVLASGELGRIVHFESRFDRYRPEVKVRWRETPGPGAGLWYDLGPHLLDQALRLFGRPEGILLERALQREGALVDDWFQATLRYGRLRALLQAGMLVPHPGPRFAVHGERGTFLKEGLDPQEGQLKDGLRPPRADWGLDPIPAELTLEGRGRGTTRSLPCGPGNYLAYYAELREAVLGRGPNPVPPEQGLEVMTWLELGLQSAESGRWRSVPAPPGPR